MSCTEYSEAEKDEIREKTREMVMNFYSSRDVEQPQSGNAMPSRSQTSAEEDLTQI